MHASGRIENAGTEAMHTLGTENLLYPAAEKSPDETGKAPLEAAETPAMDMLAAKGSCGQLDVLGGVAPESDSAVLSILGYDPHKYYTGRGPLEAAGLGIGMKPGMLALRCNFATAKAGRTGSYPPELADRRVARSLTSKEAAEIAAVISRKVKLKGAKFIFKAGVAHRAVLIIKAIKAGKKLSARITNTDPAYAVGKKGMPEALAKFEMQVKEAEPLEKEAELSAELLNDFTRQTFEALDTHPINEGRRRRGLLPANAILSRDAGNRLPELYSLPKKYGRKFSILADMPMEIGIGRLSGMKVIRLPLPTFGKEDHKPRAEKTIAALKKQDCLYIHIKGPDLYGHEGDYEGKKRCIEDIDKYFFAPLIKRINMDETIIAVTADHATPCSLKGHSGDAVPFLLSGGSVAADKTGSFSERRCAEGRFGKIKATMLMPRLMRLVRKE
ncbi:2,3-bisphosphoglycerate-independent phosphoglycerate mutase [Candidatus Woesearchaeota archaeon]|nr:2,3-bisphosphoglycerate-independent phosphoglycerate mutase [Candidatus Woesearchaeota archaeon]